MPDITLPAPLAHQVPAFQHDSRFKVLQWGRRCGKSRLKFSAGWLGHGPGWKQGTPTYPGVLQGWDVVWIARDIPQAKGIWEEEFVPRFEGRPHVTLNHTDHFVRIAGKGTFHLRSAENIASVRGIGKRLKGLLIDEAAWFDLESAWRRVLRPLLADNEGWAIFGSTTNAGLDGNPHKRTPSFFNMLCEQVHAGAREGWSVWEGTAHDNPKIKPEEFEALVAEYPPDSPELAQEVFAKLITAGGGLVFAELRDDWHLCPAGGPTEPLEHFTRVVVADWGWTNPAPAIWIETDQGLKDAPYSRVYREWWPTETLPTAWAREVLARSEVRDGNGRLLGHEIEAVIIDSNTKATTDGGPSVFEQLTSVFRPAGVRLLLAEKGPHSIKQGTQLLHTYFWTGGGKQVPLLQIGVDCPQLWNELLALRRGNPKERVSENPDIPAPHQPDHGFDALRYWAMSRPKPARLTEAQREAMDPDFQRVAQDRASVVELHRQRTVYAKTHGLPHPPPLAPKVKVTRHPWQRP